MTFFAPTYSPAESRMELEALRQASAHVLSSPDLSRKFLKALGFDKSPKAANNGAPKKVLDKRSKR